MTFGRAPEAGTGAILRALGSLIAALGDSGEGRAALIAEADRATTRASEGFARYVPEYAPARDPRTEQASLLLADARERAQRLLDDSMRRANDLLYPGGARETPAAFGMSDAALEPLHRSVDEVVRSVRDIQARLDRIEALLRDGASGRRQGLSVVPPEAPPSAPSSAPVPPPATARTGLPASATPPVRGSAQPAHAPPPPPADGVVVLRATPIAGF